MKVASCGLFYFLQFRDLTTAFFGHIPPQKVVEFWFAARRAFHCKADQAKAFQPNCIAASAGRRAATGFNRIRSARLFVAISCATT